MERTFSIHFHIRTAGGLETFARFQAGNDESSANKLFESLLGNTEVGKKEVLLVELLELKNRLPVNIKIKSCTLEELGYNCKLITKEIFRIRHIGELKRIN